MTIVVLSGGYGGAKFTQGLLHALRRGTLPEHSADTEVVVVANTADDLWIHGLRVCPDIDTLLYTLGGGLDTERGWGRREETWSISEELRAYDVPGTWFGLGDRDLATHLVRTQLLEAGFGLSDVVAALATRWQPGARILPMTDDRVETHLVIADEESPSGQRVVHFQEYWVRLRAEAEVRSVLAVGNDEATPAPGVLEALAAASLIVVPPSNPVVSVGPILGLPGMREALLASPAPIVGVSPIIGGDHVRGMARQLLTALDVEVSAAGVAGHYSARQTGGLLDGWLVDRSDADSLPRLDALGIAARAVPLWMSDIEATATMAEELAALAVAG